MRYHTNFRRSSWRRRQWHPVTLVLGQARRPLAPLISGPGARPLGRVIRLSPGQIGLASAPGAQVLFRTRQAPDGRLEATYCGQSAGHAHGGPHIRHRLVVVDSAGRSWAVRIRARGRFSRRQARQARLSLGRQLRAAAARGPLDLMMSCPGGRRQWQRALQSCSRPPGRQAPVTQGTRLLGARR